MSDTPLERLLDLLPSTHIGWTPLHSIYAHYQDGHVHILDPHEYTDAMKAMEACNHVPLRKSCRTWAPMLGDTITITHAAKNEFSVPTTRTYKVTQVDIDPHGSRVVCGAEGCQSVRIVCQGGGQ